MMAIWLKKKLSINGTDTPSFCLVNIVVTVTFLLIASWLDPTGIPILFEQDGWYPDALLVLYARHEGIYSC